MMDIFENRVLSNKKMKGMKKAAAAEKTSVKDKDITRRKNPTRHLSDSHSALLKGFQKSEKFRLNGRQPLNIDDDSPNGKMGFPRGQTRKEKLTIIESGDDEDKYDKDFNATAVAVLNSKAKFHPVTNAYLKSARPAILGSPSLCLELPKFRSDNRNMRKTQKKEPFYLDVAPPSNLCCPFSEKCIINPDADLGFPFGRIPQPRSTI